MNHTRPPCLVDVDAATQLYPNSESKLKNQSILAKPTKKSEQLIRSLFGMWQQTDYDNSTQRRYNTAVKFGYGLWRLSFIITKLPGCVEVR